MSCDVAQYITLNDAPNQEAEAIVHESMFCLPRSSRRRATKGFLPPLSMDYRVHTVHSGQILSLTGHTDSKGIYVELQANAMMLRKLHTHEGHRNPDGVEISGLHIHFPTQKYPMAYGKSEWAYPINLPYDDDLETCVQFFCHELGIDITTLQFQFDFRRR
jgi:hypothetical protein